MNIYEETTYKIFLAPAIITTVFVIAVPLVYAIYLGFCNLNYLTGTNSFIGIKNYIAIFEDAGFISSLSRNVLYTVVVVSASFVLGLLFALLAYHMKPRLQGIFNVIVVLPMLLVPVVASLLWRGIMFTPPYAEFNRLFGLRGNLLADPRFAIWAVMLVDIWGWTPWIFLPLLGALEGLPKEPLEAARIDGASFLRIVWSIILPMIKPVIVVVLGIKVIDTFRSFAYVWVMTVGGPGHSSHILSTYIYQKTFSLLDYGHGAAMSVVMLLLTTVFSIGFLIISGGLRANENIQE